MNFVLQSFKLEKNIEIRLFPFLDFRLFFATVIEVLSSDFVRNRVFDIFTRDYSSVLLHSKQKICSSDPPGVRVSYRYFFLIFFFYFIQLRSRTLSTITVIVYAQYVLLLFRVLQRTLAKYGEQPLSIRHSS